MCLARAHFFSTSARGLLGTRRPSLGAFQFAYNYYVSFFALAVLRRSPRVDILRARAGCTLNLPYTAHDGGRMKRKSGVFLIAHSRRHKLRSLSANGRLLGKRRLTLRWYSPRALVPCEQPSILFLSFPPSISPLSSLCFCRRFIVPRVLRFCVPRAWRFADIKLHCAPARCINCEFCFSTVFLFVSGSVFFFVYLARWRRPVE